MSHIFACATSLDSCLHNSCDMGKQPSCQMVHTARLSAASIMVLFNSRCILCSDVPDRFCSSLEPLLQDGSSPLCLTCKGNRVCRLRTFS